MITLLLAFTLALDDKETVVGPAVGKPAPAMKTFQAAGDQADKDVDWAEGSKDRPTLLVFVNTEKWGRPCGQFLRKLDEGVTEAKQKQAPKAQVAIIWLSKEIDKDKAYLPRVQQSLKLQSSSWNVFSGDAYDAQGWVLSGDSAVNVILIKDNKIAWGRAYNAVNADTAKPVLTALVAEKK